MYEVACLKAVSMKVGYDSTTIECWSIEEAEQRVEHRLHFVQEKRVVTLPSEPRPLHQFWGTVVLLPDSAYAGCHSTMGN